MKRTSFAATLVLAAVGALAGPQTRAPGAAPVAKKDAKLAPQRVKLLKANLDSFALHLSYLAGKKEQSAAASLSTWKGPGPAPKGHPAGGVRISKAQAAAIIDHLDKNGLLSRLLDPRTLALMDMHIPTPHLHVQVIAGKHSFQNWLPIDPKAVELVEALGKLLDGNAGKAMDKVLKALEPQRKKWQKAARPAIRGVLYYDWRGFSFGAGFTRTSVSAFEVDLERRRVRQLNAAARRPRAMLPYKEQDILKLLAQQAWVPLTEQQAANLRRLTEKWLATNPPKAYLIPRGGLGREDGRTAKLVALLKDGRRETEFRWRWANKQSPPPPEAKALMAQAQALAGGAGIKGPATAPASRPAVKWGKAVGGLVCGVSAFKPKVQLGVPYEIEVSIKNISKGDILLLKKWLLGMTPLNDRVYFMQADKTYREVFTRDVEDFALGPPAPKEGFVLLRPGDIYKFTHRTVVLTPSLPKGLRNTPAGRGGVVVGQEGAYQMQVEYLGLDMPIAKGVDLGGLKPWKGVLLSASVEIIVPKAKAKGKAS